MVDGLYNSLTARGYQPWMESRDIPPGAERSNEIDEAIRKAAFFVACLSRHSVDRRGIQKPLRDALKRLEELVRRDIFIIPLRMDATTVPFELQDYQEADFRDPDVLAHLDRAFREGLQRRQNDLYPYRPDRVEEAVLSLHPFEEPAFSTILARISLAASTPRLVVHACSTLLQLAAEQESERVTEEFVVTNWHTVGGRLLANEKELDRLITILQELAEQDGKIDEEVDLQTLQRMLDGNPGRFLDLIRRVEGVEEIISIKEQEGMTSIELSPLISPEFVRDILVKTKLDEFRRRYRQEESLEQSIRETLYRP
jgi:TIR domain